MGKILLAGLGGFVGSALRYAVAGLVQNSTGSSFPFGTLAVNFAGCAAIGFLSQLAEARGLFTAEMRVLIFVGILGGFTTFSAFSNETINLWREGTNALAVANVSAQVVLCLGVVLVSRALAVQMV